LWELLMMHLLALCRLDGNGKMVVDLCFDCLIV
jgi:hypothetical protein